MAAEVKHLREQAALLSDGGQREVLLMKGEGPLDRYVIRHLTGDSPHQRLSGATGFRLIDCARE